MRCLLPTAAVSALIVASPVAAQSTTQTAPEKPRSAHEDEDQILVVGHRLGSLGVMAGSVELRGEALARQSAAQIGDMLRNLPGVATSGFAPGASRPILRGLGGERIRVLTDGIGSLDASNVSADHGVTLDTLAIDHIDILHGPAVLAYGGEAIGGAVNAYDKRIPRKVPERLSMTGLASFDTVSDGKAAGGAIDIPLAPRLAFHVDGSWREASDLRISGDQISAPFRNELLKRVGDLRAEGKTDEADTLLAAAGNRGRIPNSFARSHSYGAGLAFIDAKGSLGISGQHVANRYGVPARPGGEEDIAITMKQTRFDYRGALETGGFFQRIETRAGFGDYQHSELEGNQVGTTFYRKGVEARIELVQRDHKGWSGLSGVHYSDGKLKVRGAEAVIPDNHVNQLAVFTVQTLRTGMLDLEAAGRAERVTIQSQPANFDRRFNLHSGAVSVAVWPDDNLKLGLTYSHGERAPSAEELLTLGAHPATQSYEIGDSTFTKERTDGFELFLRYNSASTQINASLYRTDFGGFIAPIPTGQIIDDLPVMAYRQLPARFTGGEIGIVHRIRDLGNGTVTLETRGDYVSGELKGTGPVPFMPPLRLSAAAEYEIGSITMRGEVEWNARQKRVGPFENPTAPFTLVGASLTWKPVDALSISLIGENLLNATGRRSTSVTRDYVPIAGRNLRIMAKLAF